MAGVSNTKNIYTLDNGVMEAGIGSEGAYLSHLNHLGSPVIMPSPDSVKTHGGSAVLIPYANRVRNAEYAYNGKEYRLPRNNGRNSIHGLMANQEFECIFHDEKNLELNCIMKNPGYPSELDIRIRYSISGNVFSTHVFTVNKGREHAPYMVGFHPYIYTGKTWRINTVGNVSKLLYEDIYFPSGRTEPFDFNSIDDPSQMKFDNCFAGEGKLIIHAEERTVSIKRENFPYFVIYNGEYTKGISAAVEPMTGAPDSYNNLIGLIDLKPGSSHQCSFSITVT